VDQERVCYRYKSLANIQPLNKQEETKMNHENEFNHVASIYQALTRQIERVAVIDDRVKKLEAQNLDKDQLIELLSDENKRLKEEMFDHLATIEELRELNNELDNQVERLSNKLNLRKLK
jgi:chromosome segregation ATPase